jgi:hypothetical protein
MRVHLKAPAINPKNLFTISIKGCSARQNGKKKRSAKPFYVGST